MAQGLNKSPNNQGHLNTIWLSVVVIGKNEADFLPGLFKSLPRGEKVEWIYVDSQSTDESIKIALDRGAKVYRVAEQSVCGPGTGRYIGTREASGEWILYLDGDMVLHQEFKAFLDRLKEIRGEEKALLPPETVGFTGRTRNFYLDEEKRVKEKRDFVVLSRKEMGPVKEWGRPAAYHGGAVLYRRAEVLEAGSWNPAVYQLEEIDLYSRVRARGGVVRALDLLMVDHYTPYLGSKEKLKLNFLPRYRGKELCGAGQVIVARYRDKSLLSLIRYYPYPFVVLAGLVAFLPLYLIWPVLPFLVNLLVAVWLGFIKKWYYYLVYLGNLVQMGRGLFRYRPFEPDYELVKSGDKKPPGGIEAGKGS